MLVVIGNDLINPQQITHITESVMGGGSDKGKKVINIHLSSHVCLWYVAGQDGYASACKLRGEMLDHLYA